MEFDAAIMDDRRRYGAVMSLPNIQTPISVAKSVLGKNKKYGIFVKFC